MMAVPSRDWSVFKQIFADHWEPFQHAHPRYQTAYYDDLVAKMLACGNPDTMGYLEQELADLGYETISAANGQEALDKVAAEAPDLILLDVMMPVMDGF